MNWTRVVRIGGALLIGAVLTFDLWSAPWRHEEDGKGRAVETESSPSDATGTEPVAPNLPPEVDEPFVDGRFVCRVLREGDDAPLGGARARWFARDEAGKVSERRALLSDARGFLVLDVGVFEDTALVVEADGHGRELALVGPGHETRATALEVRLPPRCSAIVSVRDPRGRAVAGLRVLVRAAHAGPRDVDEWLPPAEREPCEFAAETDADGKASLRGLPAGVEFELEARRDALTLARLDERQVLESGEQRELALETGARPKLRGRALDPTGAPIADTTLWLVPATGAASHVSSTWSEPSARAFTGPDGAFEARDLEPGEWLVAPDVRRRGLDGSTCELAPLAQPVTVPGGDACAEVELRLHRGMRLAGSVRLPDGSPARGCAVRAKATDPKFRGFELSGTCDGAGRFELGPAAPLEFVVEAGGELGGDYGRSAHQIAIGGGPELSFTVEPGATLFLAVNGVPDRVGSWPAVRLARRGDDADRPPIELDRLREATGLAGLTAGTWILHAHDGVGAAVLSVDLVAGEERRLTVPLEPAATLRLENGGKAAARFEVRSAGREVPGSWWVEPGSFEEVLLPAGRVEVTGRLEELETPVSRAIDLRVGHPSTLRVP